MTRPFHTWQTSAQFACYHLHQQWLAGVVEGLPFRCECSLDAVHAYYYNDLHLGLAI